MQRYYHFKGECGEISNKFIELVNIFDKRKRKKVKKIRLCKKKLAEGGTALVSKAWKSNKYIVY